MYPYPSGYQHPHNYPAPMIGNHSHSRSYASNSYLGYSHPSEYQRNDGCRNDYRYQVPMQYDYNRKIHHRFKKINNVPYSSQKNIDRSNLKKLKEFRKADEEQNSPSTACALSSTEQDTSKKRNAYLKAFSTKVKKSCQSYETNSSSDIENMSPKYDSVSPSKPDYSDSTSNSTPIDFSSTNVNISQNKETVQSLELFSSNVLASTSDSVCCLVCDEYIPPIQLYKHLLFGNIKCIECEMMFFTCKDYQLINSPKTSFIPSLCLHENLIFIDAIDFLKIKFSGSDEHITNLVGNYINSISVLDNVKPYELAIIKCKITFGMNLDTVVSDTKKSCVYPELITEGQSLNDAHSSNSAICYKCDNRVPEANLYKHLLFGNLKCNDCTLDLNICKEYQLHSDNVNNIAPLCLHKNLKFVEPICFIKSNFIGPNRHKNKLLLKYIKSILSIKNVKPYYSLAFEECYTLNKSISITAKVINNNISIEEPISEIKHIQSSESFTSNDLASTSESVCCHVCDENIPIIQLYRHLLFGNIKCIDCDFEFYKCKDYQSIDSPNNFFIPSICLHKNLKFIDAIDFLKTKFSGYDKSKAKQVFDYIESLSSIENLKPYDLPIKKCKKNFVNGTLNFSSNLDSTDNDIMESTVNHELISKRESLNNGHSLDSAICYKCGDHVPKPNLYKHLLFGNLKCNDCQLEINNCKEYEVHTDNVNNITQSCLHMNLIFVEPICFLKSNFIGPNRHKNKLLLKYIKSIISIKKIKPYYNLAFKECNTLHYSTSGTTIENNKDNSIKEPNNQIKDNQNVSKLEYNPNTKQTTPWKSYLELPADDNYLFTKTTIENCPMCYRKLKPKNATVHVSLWYYEFKCKCKLLIYYIPPTPANIKPRVWIEEF
ncbi:unnamed protein product [Meganyctiphanes norvegica]|uniref:Uncharacterized protein n=1 Tax=Meganyctiphanes norvegica TaxID=48144 RepID=A0AAV2RN80_MEGNR